MPDQIDSMTESFKQNSAYNKELARVRKIKSLNKHKMILSKSNGRAAHDIYSRLNVKIMRCIIICRKETDV